MMDAQCVKSRNRQETPLKSIELDVGDVDLPEIISILRGLLVERVVTKKSLAVLSIFCSDLAFRALCQKGGSYLQRHLECASRSLITCICGFIRRNPTLNAWMNMFQRRSPWANYIAVLSTLTFCLVYYCHKLSS